MYRYPQRLPDVIDILQQTHPYSPFVPASGSQTRQRNDSPRDGNIRQIPLIQFFFKQINIQPILVPLGFLASNQIRQAHVIQSYRVDLPFLPTLESFLK